MRAERPALQTASAGRQIVLDPTQEIEVQVSGHRQADVALDGRFVQTLGDGEVVRCTSSSATARFVRFGEFHFHQILKAKFGLQDR